MWDGSNFNSTVTVNPNQGHITASGNISAIGRIYADRYYVEGKQAIDYTVGNKIVYGQNDTPAKLRGDYIQLGEDATQHVTASGNISASGDIQCNTLIGTINGGTF